MASLARGASEVSSLIAKMSIRPVLANDLTVRAPHPNDIAAMGQLELSAAIVRDDGTELSLTTTAGSSITPLSPAITGILPHSAAIE